MSELPLSDLKVLDFSWVVAGPAIGRSLADYGATVIRIESRKKIDTARLIGPFHNGEAGPENSALYGNVNAGKYGLTLDMSNEHARGIVLDLVRWTDVLIESFSPGVMKKWGLDYETLKEINPRLIMLSTSMLGNSGPYSKFAGFGNLGSAMSGIMNLAGWPDEAPKGPFGPYTDFVGPRFSIAILLAALDYAKKNGEGCYIDLSQVETGIHFIAQGVLDYFVNGHQIQRNGNADENMAPHGVYACLEENGNAPSFVAISIKNDRQWKDFARLIGGDEFAENPRYLRLEERKKHAEEIDGIVRQWASEITAEEAEEKLQSLKIPAHKVASIADIYKDSQFQHQGHFIELDHPLHQKTVVEGSRYALSETPAIVSRPAPLFGEHNDFILNGILKYDEKHIEKLKELGVFK